MKVGAVNMWLHSSTEIVTCALDRSLTGRLGKVVLSYSLLTLKKRLWLV